MKKTMLLMVFLVLFLPELSFANHLTNLEDTNYIRIAPINKNGMIEVIVFYENTDKGLDVLWSNKPLEYTCYLYHEDGSQILRKDGKLYSFDQRIYIKIPSWDRNEDEKGIVECEFDVGWPHLKAKASVSLK